jgi:23S rRNA pseudouridine1911/1915/1917 synthase
MREGVRTKLQILYHDERIVAVAKPAGLASIPGRAEPQSVLSLLAGQIGLPFEGDADPRLRVVHRLDKDTSGVMAFALDRGAQQHLSHQFQNNRVEKEYLALVAGRPAEEEGEIDAPLGAHPTIPERRAVLKKGGRPARTVWRLEQRLGAFSLLRVFPKTGKTHQIRVHLAHIGLPLAIDPLYHPDAGEGLMLSQIKRSYRASRGQEERPLIARLTLHAHRLALEHPDGRMLHLEAELPKDFRATINQLARWSR